MDQTSQPALLDAYLEMREDLKRYFVLRLGSPSAAEDLVQEIYLKIVAAPALAQIENPSAYLYRLGSNLMLDHLRSQKRSRSRDSDWQRAHTLSAGEEAITEDPSADDAIAAKQQLAQILSALEEVSPRARRVFILHKIEGLSHAETAAALGISRSAVEKHVSAVLKHLLRRVK